MKPINTDLRTAAEKTEGVTRLFYAVCPGASVTRQLAQYAKTLAALCHGRAMHIDCIHMTLAFMGDIPDSRQAELLALTPPLCALPGCTLALTHLARFKGGTLCLEPETPPAALLRLQQALASSLRAEGFSLETRSFRPHVTLVRNAKDPLPALVYYPVSDFAVDQLVLLSSSLQEQGAVYRRIASWPLALPDRGFT